MTDADNMPPIKRKSYKLSQPLITEDGIAEAEYFLTKQLAVNVSHECAAYIMLCLEAGRTQLAGASKNRAHLRDERIRYSARHEHFNGLSDRQTASEMLAIANRIKDRPATEPEYSIWRIKELNGRKMPSAETIRKCLALK